MPSLLSRRAFLGAATAAGILASRASAKSLAPKRLGAELYTVRSLMPAKDDDVLHTLASTGYREVEGDYPTLMRIHGAAQALGLNPVACHIPTASVLGGEKAPELEKVLTDLKGIGTEYAVVPYIAPDQRTVEILSGFGEKMTRAGEMAKRIGLQLAYHNHAFEWKEVEGKMTFHRMFEHTDPKLVQLEIDVFWLSVAGVDPVHFLKDHAGRIPLVHLKDKAAAQKVQYNEMVPKDTFREVGNGSIDFKAVLETCEKIGVKHYFVEQDWTSGDPLVSLKQSFHYISGLKS